MAAITMMLSIAARLARGGGRDGRKGCLPNQEGPLRSGGRELGELSGRWGGSRIGRGV
jgi:hypothetical protein